ncbi:MAG: phosphoenolpyruvate carboxykinase (GTP) [Deltaproteobacteria bacterium CG11_big_fil_rev_8_21_14_0_20_49_13]|nr:MAG: phosphoenolpyruvate carboxykinase (GTP) [Deltaproteobacteria bacterium CG11_big_fil_rev_8_21_14_0_20_49_13]
MATAIEKWVEEQANLAKPKNIHWCDGSDEEAHRLIEIGLKEEEINGHKVFSELSNYPGSYLHRSHPSDVARTEHLTFVCHPDKETVGPNNNWMDPASAKAKMIALSDGCMKGRTMYVLPYMMGHPESSYAKACIQITDTSYVAISMRIMTRLGKNVLDKIGNSQNFVKGFHSIGDLDPEKRFIMHFPLEGLVWSVGSGYGGNALLGKKCFSLRIASWLGLNEGWLAEHMVIIGIEDPEGKVTYVTAAMPSACGKTNLAMLESALPGHKVWTLGDDIAWLNVGPDGRLWAINPEAGFFGVAPGTSMSTNPNMIRMLKKGTFYPTLFTNTALDTKTNEPWWEGLTKTPPDDLLDWQGRPWKPGSEGKAAHANSRFTVSLTHCPTLSKESDNPVGVPISAIIFGGRRKQLIPLVTESFNWAHGVFSGARMGSETTAAATSKIGQLRRDPMAMIPFCGYNMADYFGNWLKIGKKCTKPPKIFSVNWFRADDEGNFIWPGFGDNIRVLKWIIDRTADRVPAEETPIGLVPRIKDLDVDGMDIPKGKLAKLFEVDMSEWKDEVNDIRGFLARFGTRLPKELADELKNLDAKAR